MTTWTVDLSAEVANLKRSVMRDLLGLMVAFSNPRTLSLRISQPSHGAPQADPGVVRGKVVMPCSELGRC